MEAKGIGMKPNPKSFAMLAAFQVGNSEVHSIEVSLSTFFARHTVKVDGEEIINKKGFSNWPRNHVQFEVGDQEKHQIELKYNILALSSRVYVDGKLYVGCLFPQLIGYTALIIAIYSLI